MASQAILESTVETFPTKYAVLNNITREADGLNIISVGTQVPVSSHRVKKGQTNTSNYPCLCADDQT